MKVHFIGAGPGDPELITVRGHRLIGEAQVIIWAGSLVNPAVIGHRRPEATVHDSAGMHLEAIVAVMVTAVRAGKTVARVHTGEPSLYGAIREQIDLLDQAGIPWEVVPGVSSFAGAAAALGAEYTLPGISQSLIITRQEGRTPVPAGEKLSALAGHGTSMALFLSAGMIEKVLDELRAAGRPETTPVTVVYRATWPDQQVIAGTIADIAAKVAAVGISRQALILVGEFLNGPVERSKLYDRSFTHGWRAGE